MSILVSGDAGWVLSHPGLIKEHYCKTQEGDSIKSYSFKNSLFEINSPYTQYISNSEDGPLKRKRKIKKIDYSDEVLKVQKLFQALTKENLSIFQSNDCSPNVRALEESKNCYTLTSLCNLVGNNGHNENDFPIKLAIENAKYLFPSNCRFFSKNVKELQEWQENTKEVFDFIVMDPPWWNKYIRRKKSKMESHSYQMLYNEELRDMPIGKLLSKNGIVVVWCTNSETHLNAIKNSFFPAWNVRFLSRWFWLKITTSGNPVCKFNTLLGKQPFEQIIIGCHSDSDNTLNFGEKLIASVPSAIHSHKPPLSEVFKEYINSNSKCLEIFARSLLPNWTSWGLEVLRLQNECLFQVVDS